PRMGGRPPQRRRAPRRRGPAPRPAARRCPCGVSGARRAPACRWRQRSGAPARPTPLASDRPPTGSAAAGPRSAKKTRARPWRVSPPCCSAVTDRVHGPDPLIMALQRPPRTMLRHHDSIARPRPALSPSPLPAAIVGVVVGVVVGALVRVVGGPGTPPWAHLLVGQRRGTAP